jgi:hypothetical protein
MANPNTPFGLSPINRLDGAGWRDSLTLYFVPAAQTNALYVGDPVIKKAAAADTNGVNAVDLASAGAGNLITGVVCGFYGVCAAGAAAPSFFGLSGTPGPAFRPATTSLDYYVLVNDDPEAEFVIQENDNVGGVAGTPLAVTAVGKNANLVSGTGSQYTGLSGWMLQANGTATTQNFQLNIKGFLQEADNVAGAAFAKVIVSINQHTETPNSAGI